MPTPRSQKAGDRPIGFVLHDFSVDTSPLIAFNLNIRPEDLTRTEGSRLAVQQTLGGAWADNFGRGLVSITISGHTGWRGTPRGGDGMELFQELYDNAYLQWHLRRKQAAEAGKNPDLVKLVFADALDDYSAVVSPGAFTLRRAKNRPLLQQYNLSMTVLSEDVDFDADKTSLTAVPAGSDLAAIDSLNASIGIIQGGIPSDMSTSLDSALAGLGAASANFANLSAGMFGKVSGIVSTVQSGINSVTEPLIGTAANLAIAGRNIFQTVATIQSLPARLEAGIMRVAGAYSNVYCIFRNAFSGSMFFPNYSSLFGAANCSSTNGGSPISAFMNSNGLEAAFTPDQLTNISIFRINGIANNALVTMKAMDPVNAPPALQTLRDSMNQMNSGIGF